MTACSTNIHMPVTHSYTITHLVMIMATQTGLAKTVLFMECVFYGLCFTDIDYATVDSGKPRENISHSQ